MDIVKNAVGYIRISTKDQSQYSLEYQERNVRSYCDQHSLNLISLFKDNGESSYTFDRPDWKALELFIKENKSIQYLIIFDVDRFSRNLAEALLKIKELENKFGIKVLATTENFDTDFSDPASYMMRAFKLMIAESELHRIRQRTKSGMLQAALNGRYTTTAPYGYINARDKEGKPILLIDEERAFIVKTMFKDYLRGLSLEEVKKTAKGYGFNRSGNSAVRYILSNPTYAAMIKIPAHKGKPETFGRALHQGIVSENDFWQVQQRLNEKRIAIQRKEDVPLRGVLRCHICGHLLTAGKSKGRSKHYWYYVCNTHRINLPASMLHRQMNEILDTLSLSEEDIKWYSDELGKEISEMLSTKSQAIARTEKALRQIAVKIEEVEERYLLGNVSKAVFERTKSKLISQQIDFNKRLYNLDANQHDYYERITELLHALRDIRGLLERETLHVRQQFLNLVFNASLVHDGKIYRTVYLDELFAHNALELKEKGLLEIEQSFAEIDEIPIRAPERT